MGKPGLIALGTARSIGKPVIVNPDAYGPVARWIKENNIKVLNVAGNRVSKQNPGIYQTSYAYLDALFKILKYVEEG